MAGTGRGFETTTGLVIQQGIFQDSLTAKHKVGTRMQLADGRVFYYASCQAAGALSPGQLCMSQTNHADYNTMTVTTGDGAAIGAKSIAGVTIGGEAFTANQFAEGWMIVESAAGLGRTYKIKSNTSGTSAGTNLDVVFYDPIQVALTTSSVVSFAYNPFALVQASTVVTYVQTSAPAGVPQCAITASYFGWLQTWGVCGVFSDASPALSIGHKLNASTESGAVAAWTTDTETETGSDILPAIGYNYGVVAKDAAYAPVMLQLYP
jgi:hypothetical protein